jgi:CRISPR-associated exonuclease Cas4
VYKEEDFLQLSGLQHFSFCRRQWALIHAEMQWQENYHTADGRLMHERAHDAESHETRGDLLIYRAMGVCSARLGVAGQCDVVEFHRNDNGVTLDGREGKWQPFPIEYKRGSGKYSHSDTLQLCCQSMCLEEMLCCRIPRGAIYYGQTKHREYIELSDILRKEVEESLAEMHELISRGHTPKVKPKKACESCSLKDICLPKLSRTKSVKDYLQAAAEREEL